MKECKRCGLAIPEGAKHYTSTSVAGLVVDICEACAEAAIYGIPKEDRVDGVSGATAQDILDQANNGNPRL